MNETAERLVRLLADGELHSGARLAASLGVTRAAVWKIVGELRGRGIEVLSHERRGYQLACPAELLDAAALRASAQAAGLAWPQQCEVHFELGSTNEYLHAAAAPPPGAARLVFAELQTAGRGRRGRAWVAPFGTGLTFSIGWTFAEMPADLSALSLALGTCVVRALRELGAPAVQLKWPNDIVQAHRKLGGLLLQMRSEAGGPAYVVAGLGLNLRMPQRARTSIESSHVTPVTDLAEACGGTAPARIEVAARTAGRMLEGLERFARHGYAPFAPEWSACDSLRDAPVTVLRHDGSVEGIARGADAEGALLLETAPGRVERVHAGDVSLRRAEARAS
ncbi:MAG TPA: biotin--[acetyl-CoA-carboxylase] ligase [Steroidobacteraceae bacterium]|nr:biotin--[acetyl-CoA-carboxylase] ligase [Steroidobacteraceae bacterium]